MRDAILNLLYPKGVRCMQCGEVRRMDMENCLCSVCMEELESERIPASSCERCLSYVEKGTACAFCRDGGLDGIRRAYAPYQYVNAARNLVLCIKFESVEDCVPLLADAMADSLKHRDFDVLVPVPLHFFRMRERGFNQAMLLAQALSKRVNIPVADALKRVRATRAQSTLSKRADRERNVKDAFRMRADASVLGKRVLLVDDVRTSGNTARACAEELLKNGAAEVSLCTVCVVWKYQGKKFDKQPENRKKDRYM
ncbi:MAG: ComF family protein [Clostridia bacterium]|nr:ComF family protein [Clostridia bacterium]